MRKILWGCALLLACLPPAFAQEGDAKPAEKPPAEGKPKDQSPAQSESQKPKAPSDAAQPSAGAEGGDASAGGGGRRRGGPGGGPGGGSDKAEKTIYDFELPGPDGKGVSMSEFKGKVILLVNLARNSGYNEQLPGLIKLSEEFKDKGLVVIGVPSNDFGAAEPGTDAEIQKAYTDAKVPFPVMALSKIIGDDKLPLYEFLTKGESGGSGGGGGARGGGGGAPSGGGPGGAGGASSSSTGDVHWNYTKFLIDRSGKVVDRLDPDVTPDSAQMLATLDKLFESNDDKPRGPRPGGRPQQQAPPKNNTTASNSDI